MYLLLSAALVATAGPLKIGVSPNDAIAPALADVTRLPRSDARYTRYLTLYAIPPADRADVLLLLNAHVHRLSREALRAPPRLVAPTLLAIDLRNYGWPRAVYERLATIEYLYHTEVVRPSTLSARRGRLPARKRVNALGSIATDNTRLARLSRLTNSGVPIVYIGWFIRQTLINENRVVGYYSLLGFKRRADFDRFIGFNAKINAEVRREQEAILRRSGVSRNNRQIHVDAAASGRRYYTKDVFKEGTRRRNALTSLDSRAGRASDFTHDAEEHFGNNRLGLFVFLLCDKNGNLQDVAPPQIGFDSTTTSNDGNIHVGLCFRCHREGLRPINDYGRKVLRLPTGIASIERRRFFRLAQLYVSELSRNVRRDSEDHAFALAQLNGPEWTPLRDSRAIAKWWYRFNDADVSARQAALELGTTEAHLIASISTYKAKVGIINLVLEGLLAGEPMLREHFEEQYQLLATVIRGGAPRIER